MKKIGMGLERSIDEVPNYFERVKDDPLSVNGQTSDSLVVHDGR